MLHLEKLKRNLEKLRGSEGSQDTAEDWVTDTTIRFLEGSIKELQSVKSDAEEFIKVMEKKLADEGVQPENDGV